MFHYSNTETLEMSGKALKKKHCTKLAFQAGRVQSLGGPLLKVLQ
jgi:hypothetical protein